MKSRKKNWRESRSRETEVGEKIAPTTVILYGRKAVQHKLKNSLKTQKMHFLPVFELMSDSLTTI